MAPPFRVLPTPALEREFRAISRKDSAPVRALQELIEILSNDPHNRNGRYQIKKRAGVKLGEGQWRTLERLPPGLRYFWKRSRTSRIGKTRRAFQRLRH